MDRMTGIERMTNILGTQAGRQDWAVEHFGETL